MRRLFAIFLIVFCLAQQVAPKLPEQALPKKIANFSVLNGDAQLLPGGIVVVTEDDRQRKYSYQREKFVRTSIDISPNLRGWKSFDWEGVDYLNQIDKADFDPAITHLLPTGSKVKKALDAPSGERGRQLVVVCYSLPTTEEHPGITKQDLFIAGLGKTETIPNDLFTVKWSLKLETAYAYGYFTLERIPGVGLFAVLYSAGTGGSGVTRDLDIYLIRP
jgi:hypothetical protein